MSPEIIAALSGITTPFALASLLIIASIGVLKLLVTGRNNALNRLITHYGFIAVIVFGLLGNIAYLIGQRQNSEYLVFGTVIDE